MSYSDVPDGEVAAVVTFLEMREARQAPVPPSPLALRRIERPSVEAYRALFRMVGEHWLWFSRLAMADERLEAIIHDPLVEVFAVEQSGTPVGLVELDLRKSGQCELAFIGLIPSLSGKGHGRWLLAETLRHAWREGVDLVHVHTCSLDHPAALAAYRRAGFTAVRRGLERFPDPRLRGLLPRGCAPQVPLLGTETCGSPAGPAS